jgi:hypothetical protein
MVQQSKKNMLLAANKPLVAVKKNKNDVVVGWF